ncbi:MAG: O-antigen ligase family protein [bacterium]|nr:MAG: O-antigen ligase family protein [bacterium]
MLYLISLLSLSLPFQLVYHFDIFATSVYGFSIDYLIPKLYLTDVVTLLVIFFGIRKIKFTRKYLIFTLLYLMFASINIYNSLFATPAIYGWIKVSEMLLLGLVIINLKKFDIYNHFIKPLSYSIFIVCVLGLLQFLTKGSIGGIFYWLGERAFIFSDPNVAPYPYATFSHPNSFAGFLLIFGMFLLQLKSKFNPRYFWALLILVITNLILTNSLNVYLTVLVLLLVKLRTIFASGLFFIDFGERFIVHRIELIKASLQLIKENFWTGTGVNNFIPGLVKVSNTYLNVWEMQPVHNIFLLVFSETGIMGVIVFCFVLLAGVTSVNYYLIAIIFTGMSDHYWITLQQNLLLFTFVLALSKIAKKH